jgi:hypothetical protein
MLKSREIANVLVRYGTVHAFTVGFATVRARSTDKFEVPTISKRTIIFLGILTIQNGFRIQTLIFKLKMN